MLEVEPAAVTGGPATWDRPASEIAALLAGSVGLSPREREGVVATAARWVTTVRAGGVDTGPVQSLLSSYDLSSEEGIALLCIAEAVLRIPDAATMDALIAGKIGGADWRLHLGNRRGWFAGVSAAALLVTGRLMETDDSESAFHRMVRRLGEPLVRQAIRAAVRFLGGQFVHAATIGEAVSAPYPCSFDMLGEGARTVADARRYLMAYEHAIETAGQSGRGRPMAERHGVSIKLTALHPRFEAAKRDRIMDELLPTLRALARRAAAFDISLCIDAEELHRLDLTMDLVDAVAADGETRAWHGLGVAIQTYHKRGLEIAEAVIDMARRTGRRMMPRLVKGAYWDTEVKRAQELGLRAYPVFTVKAHADVCYLACAAALLRARDVVHPCFATHNAHTGAAVTHLAGDGRGWEFQRLHGMGEALHALLEREAGARSRVYAPVGHHRHLLAYLVRRLLENGANSSFVAQIGDERIPVEAVVADPLTATNETELPPPLTLFPDRPAAIGLDLARADHRDRVLAALAVHDRTADNAPLPRTPDEALAALAMADAAAPRWRATAVAERADMLRRASDRMEASMESLVALLAREAGRTLANGVGEVREAVDYLRYYAAQAEHLMVPRELPGPTGERNVLVLEGRGPFLCIAPWNFPLAIFTGQVAGALAAGNTVLAKPAERTPRVARLAVRILHEAGIPTDVLHDLPGSGPDLAGPLLADPRLAGVAFTGGTATAQAINRRLAERLGPIIPLIAETGGINAMIVDSSALPEQVTRDVIAGAFDSAGQRCSSLRMLYIQKEIADDVIAMLAGAVDELALGDPGDPATDVGPIIDGEAAAAIDDWIAGLPALGARRLACAAPPAASSKGTFIAPQVWEMPTLAPAAREIFGPVLHVARYRASEMDRVIAAIDGTGYGLTFAIHSRCDARIAHVAAAVSVGNVYINRSQIGAVVGVTPFGGHGLSGTGPKAGGPHYLLRFLRERTITADLTAAGGNVQLLSGRGPMGSS